MTGLEAAAWGVFGGFAVEGLEFTRAIRRAGEWPWRRQGEPGPVPLVVSVLIRLIVGAGLAAATVSAGQVQGPFGALAIGVAAPLLIEQLSQQFPAKLRVSPDSAEITDDAPTREQQVRTLPGSAASREPRQTAPAQKGREAGSAK